MAGAPDSARGLLSYDGWAESGFYSLTVNYHYVTFKAWMKAEKKEGEGKEKKQEGEEVTETRRDSQRLRCLLCSPFREMCPTLHLIPWAAMWSKEPKNSYSRF